MSKRLDENLQASPWGLTELTEKMLPVASPPGDRKSERVRHMFWIIHPGMLRADTRWRGWTDPWRSWPFASELSLPRIRWGWAGWVDGVPLSACPISCNLLSFPFNSFFVFFFKLYVVTRGLKKKVPVLAIQTLAKVNSHTSSAF